MEIKIALTIAGSDSGGGAGIQADLKTFTAFGVFGISVLTSITAQNTSGVQGVHDLPPDFVAMQLDSVLRDMGADASKTGMLSNSGIIEAVSAKVREYSLKNLVVDPVMVAKSGDPLLKKEARDALITRIIPLAFLVTPNLHEASVLAEREIKTLDEMKEAAKVIYGMGPAYVLIKGGHLTGSAIDILYDGKEYREFISERINSPNTHGTGCTFSAAIAANLAKGEDIFNAIDKAKKFVTEAIRQSFAIGKGVGPLNHFVRIED